MYVEVKQANRHNKAGTITLCSSVVGGTVSLMAALLKKDREGPIYGTHPHNFKWLVLRGVLGGISVVSAFAAIQVRRRRRRRMRKKKKKKKKKKRGHWRLLGGCARRIAYLPLHHHQPDMPK